MRPLPPILIHTHGTHIIHINNRILEARLTELTEKAKAVRCSDDGNYQFNAYMKEIRKVYTHTHIQIQKHTDIQTYIHTYIHTYILHTHTHTYIHTYTHTCMHTCVLTYVHAHTIHIYITACHSSDDFSIENLDISQKHVQ